MSQENLLWDARAIFDRALQDCRVESALQRKVRGDSERKVLLLDEQEIDLTGVRHLRVVAAGKASVAMLIGFLDRAPLGSGCDVEGVLIAPSAPERMPKGIRFFAGGHPLPNQASFDGARAALDLIAEASALDDALCVFLLSGGASAMMELPLDPGISLEATVAFYRLLVHSGATIAEINCIRKHFSAVKGGRLGMAAGDTPSLSLMVSDVAPRHLDALGSGPTIADSSTVAECRELLARYAIRDSLPESIRRYFASPALSETPKPGCFPSRICVLLDSDDLAEAAAHGAEELGYHVVLDNACDDWGYAEAAAYLLGRLRELRLEHERVCLLSTGEVTVAVPADLPAANRRGGRNQHFALYAGTLLRPSDGTTVVLSAGSDGVDGNSEAAGAVLDGHLLESADSWQESGRALADFDSSTWLEARGASIVTGPTGNNLRDLRILLATTDSKEGAR